MSELCQRFEEGEKGGSSQPGGRRKFTHLIYLLYLLVNREKIYCVARIVQFRQGTKL